MHDLLVVVKLHHLLPVPQQIEQKLLIELLSRYIKSHKYKRLLEMVQIHVFVNEENASTEHLSMLMMSSHLSRINTQRVQYFLL